MKRIYVAQTPAEAHVVAGLLEEEGIGCAIEGEMLTGVRYDVPPDQSTLPTVSVADEDAVRATEILRDGGHTPAAWPEGAPPVGEELVERPSLRTFKKIVLLWLLGPLVIGFAFAMASIPYAVAACAAFGVVVVVLWPRARKS